MRLKNKQINLLELVGEYDHVAVMLSKCVKLFYAIQYGVKVCPNVKRGSLSDKFCVIPREQVKELVHEGMLELKVHHGNTYYWKEIEDFTFYDIRKKKEMWQKHLPVIRYKVTRKARRALFRHSLAPFMEQAITLGFRLKIEDTE